MTDRLHLLCLTQLTLELGALLLRALARTDVAHDRKQVRPPLIVHACTAQLDLDRLAVRTDRGTFALERAALSNARSKLAAHLVTAGGEQIVGAAAEHVLALISERGQERGVDVGDPALFVEDRHAIHRRVEDGTILLLARGQRLLCALALCNVGRVGSQDDSDDWDIGHADALKAAEREAWARHAARANGSGAAEACFDSEYDDVCTSLHDAIRRVSDLPWD